MTDLKPVAAHVLRHLARAQSLGRAIHLEDLAEQIGVRRGDVREVVTCLHQEGHVDARRMRLTMTGLAIAASMRECKLRPARVVERPSQMHVA
jgi:DNA-binding MarR family transcriptional regulator